MELCVESRLPDRGHYHFFGVHTPPPLSAEGDRLRYRPPPRPQCPPGRPGGALAPENRTPGGENHQGGRGEPPPHPVAALPMRGPPPCSPRWTPCTTPAI